MLGRSLKVSIKMILTCLLVLLPLSGFCGPEEMFPYHIDRTVEKEIIYPYSFDKVWDAALAVMQNKASVMSEDMRKKNIKTFRSDIRINRESQLIIYTSSHKDRKGFLETVLPEFTYQLLYIYPVDKMKTAILTNNANYILYNGAVLDIEQNARQFYSTRPDEDILLKIRDRLKDEDSEK